MSKELIYAMSTKKSMKISDFNKYLRDTYQNESSLLGQSINLRNQMVRVLESLGYCEFNYDENIVYMCKPSLVLLPLQGLPKVLLVGARTPDYTHKLKKVIKDTKGKAIYHIYEFLKININIPPTFIIEANDQDIIEYIAKERKIDSYTEIPAAWALANFSASIDDIKSKLRFERRGNPNCAKEIFQPNRLHFSRQYTENEDHLSLVNYFNPINNQPYHLLWDGENATQIERDWGRYIVLSSMNKNILHYDKKTYQLTVPATVPLPCILARAITMCTGFAPKMVSYTPYENISIPAEHPVLIYSGVPPLIASLVASKLGQNLV